jgi:hypothetical protein
MLAIVALLLVFLTVRGVAWTLTRPVTMAGILYVARFRMPVPLLIGAVFGFGAVALIVGRLIVFVAQSLALAFVVTIDNYNSQLLFYAAMLTTAVALSILYLSLFPRKIIVFPDHLRIKFLAYRSRVLKPDDLLEISTRRFHQVWFRKDVFRSVPLAWGLVGPGIYLRPTKGRAYFFRTRNTAELVDVLGGWRGASVSPAAAKKKPIARDPFEDAQDTADWIASISTDSIPKGDEPLPSIASDPLPEPEEPSDSIAPDPLPELDEPSDSIDPDPLPELDEPSASGVPDPLPEDEEAPVSIASMLLGPSAGDEEPPVSIASIAPDAISEDGKGGVDFDNAGMNEGDIKDLLGESYDPDADKKF